jgi:hypothetical protein
MVQRYGQVSSMAGKVQRKYVKKACPEGCWHSSVILILSYARLTYIQQTIIPTFWNTLPNLPVPSDTRSLLIRYESSALNTRCDEPLLITFSVAKVVYPFSKKQEILQLLEEHITENIVKVNYLFMNQRYHYDVELLCVT